jgi:hypothetical protein
MWSVCITWAFVIRLFIFYKKHIFYMYKAYTHQICHSCQTQPNLWVLAFLVILIFIILAKLNLRESQLQKENAFLWIQVLALIKNMVSTWIHKISMQVLSSHTLSKLYNKNILRSFFTRSKVFVAWSIDWKLSFLVDGEIQSSEWPMLGQLIKIVLKWKPGLLIKCL